MVKRFWVIIVLVFLIDSFVPNIAVSQSYRENLTIPPSEVFQKILDYISQGEFNKIERSIQFLAPLIKYLEEKHSIKMESNIREGIEKKDLESILKHTHKLIFLDMKDLFELSAAALKESPEKAKVKLKIAYLDYLLLSQFVQLRNFSSDGKIKRAFRDLSFILESLSPYQAEGGSSLSVEKLNKTTGDIEREIFNIFPELK